MTKHQTDSNYSETQFLHSLSFEVTEETSWYNKMLHEIIQDNGKDSARRGVGVLWIEILALLLLRR